MMISIVRYRPGVSPCFEPTATQAYLGVEGWAPYWNGWVTPTVPLVKIVAKAPIYIIEHIGRIRRILPFHFGLRWSRMNF